MELFNIMKRTSVNESKKCSILLRHCWESPYRWGSNLLPIVILFALTLSGCTEEDDLENQKEDTFNGTLTAKVENGASYEAQISTVWALYDATTNSAGELNGRMLVASDYTNGGFTINLPEIPAQFLMNIATFFSSVLNISSELEIDDPDARLLFAEFFGITSDNNYVDSFKYTNTGSKRTTCHFVFVNSDVTVKGGSNINVTLHRGWNRIYWTSSDNKVVSNAPSGMKWYLNKDVK